MTRPPLRADGLAETTPPYLAGISARLVLACLAAPAAARRRRSALIAGLLMACFGQFASAQTSYSWTTAANGNWNDSTNWTVISGAGTTFPVAGDTATFNASGMNGAETVYLGQTTSRGQEMPASLTFANTGTTMLVGGISGTGVLNILTLSGGGGITLNTGAGVSTIGTSAGNVQVNVNGNQAVQNNSTSPSASLNFTNNIAGVATGTSIVTFSGSGYTTLAGTIQDSTTESLANAFLGIAESSGTLEIDGTNTYHGGTTLYGGTMLVKSSNALGINTGNSNQLTINGGTLASLSSARTIPANVPVVVGGNFALGGQGQAITFNGTVDLAPLCARLPQTTAPPSTASFPTAASPSSARPL